MNIFNFVQIRDLYGNTLASLTLNRGTKQQGYDAGCIAFLLHRRQMYGFYLDILSHFEMY